jgi:hypothetical protein
LFFKQSGDAFRLPQGLVELGWHGSHLSFDVL